MRRREFLGAAALAAQAETGRAQVGRPKVKLGIDLFSVRSQGWTAFQHLDYAARQKAQVVHFSEIRFLGSLEEPHLAEVRAHAEKLGIEVEIGMRSICPTSTAFDRTQGTAEEQLTRMARSATVVGSRIVRAFLGTAADRAGGAIDRNIENAVKVLRNCRAVVMDAGLKVAIENHAGDMQARELKGLIEAAGSDFVGACLDSGNPLWTLEDPHLTLETLAPHVLTSHVRDSAVWRIPEGAAVAWTRMGEGNVGIDDYVRKYVKLCPGRALSMETIVTGARKYPFLEAGFWDAYRRQPAWEFSRFLKIADSGKPRPDPPKLPKEQAVEREREDLEASIRYTQALLGG